MISLRDEFDEMLNDVYGNLARAGEVYEGDWCPVMDVSETDDKVTARLELPGLKKEDIKVSVHNDILSVSGEKKQEKTEEAENVCRIERSYGFFKRSVTLPTEVDASKVKATVKDGVLEVAMPKQESKKPREIPVQVS
jgi:HSP20 family protein